MIHDLIGLVTVINGVLSLGHADTSEKDMWQTLHFTSFVLGCFMFWTGVNAPMP